MAYRKDRNITKTLPGFRRILSHLTPTRNDAVIYFEQTLRLEKTLVWLEEYNKKTGRKITLLQLFVFAVGKIFLKYPRLNRYVTGFRTYQRDGVTISISAKKEFKNDSKIVLLKIPVDEKSTLESIHDTIQERLKEGRSKDIHQEKEIDLFLKLPGFLLAFAIKLLKWLDNLHLLPGFFVDPDPLYTSLVVANIGSIGLDAGFHHLYEYGNCPFFSMIGKIHNETYEENGTLKTGPVVKIKHSFDERIEDALACAFGLEDF